MQRCASDAAGDAKVGPLATKRAPFGQVTRMRSGRYQARYAVPGADRKVYVTAPQTFERLRDARDWLARERVKIIDGVVRPKALASRVTVAEYGRDWINSRRNRDGEPLRPSTRRVYEHYLEREIAPVLGAVEIAKLDKEQVDGWYRRLLPDRPTLRARTYSFLRTVLSSAVDDGLLPANPCKIRGGGGVGRPRVGKDIATPAQAATLAAGLPERLSLAVHLGYWAQLRNGEVLELRRKDITPTTVAVSRGVTWVNGRPVVGPPKTDAGVRTLALPAFLGPIVEAHLAENTAPGGEALLFPGKEGTGQHMHSSTFAYYFKAAVRRTGLPEEFRFHWLRHSGLTLAGQTGATTSELQNRAGHTTPAMAMHYQHATSERDRTLAAALDRLATR